MEGAPAWAKTPFLYLMEQMSKVNKDVTNVKEQLEMFKSKDIQDVSKLRGTLEKQLTKIQTTVDNIKQYSQRNCLIFNGIQEQEESHENTDLIVVDICCKNLGVNLSWGIWTGCTDWEGKGPQQTSQDQLS